MATLLPTLIQVVCIGIDRARAMCGFAFWKSIRAQSAADGAAIETELASNSPIRHAASSQLHHLLIAAVAPIPNLLLLKFGQGRSRNHWHSRRL